MEIQKRHQKLRLLNDWGPNKNPKNINIGCCLCNKKLFEGMKDVAPANNIRSNCVIKIAKYVRIHLLMDSQLLASDYDYGTGIALMLNGFTARVWPYDSSIFGITLSSSGRRSNFWTSAVINRNSSIMANGSPKHFRLPLEKKYSTHSVTKWCYKSKYGRTTHLEMRTIGTFVSRQSDEPCVRFGKKVTIGNNVMRWCNGDSLINIKH